MTRLASYALAWAGIIKAAHSFTFGSVPYSNNFGQPGVNASYDYVVVGGGTGGLAVASRLAENGTYSVAVIEAGGFYEQENGNLTLIPGMYSPNIAGPSTNWFFTTQSPSELSYPPAVYSRGKTLGGSSALNAMLYQIGSAGSYQAWADAVGDDSWAFDKFHPYFQKSVHYTAPNAQLRAQNASVPPAPPKTYSNSAGPLHVSYPNTAQPFASWGQRALREIGLPDQRDFSSGKLMGSQYCPLTIRPHDQTRSSSSASYLQSAFGRNQVQPTLSVYIHSLAKRILFDSHKNAKGVIVQSGLGLPYQISANKEVIVSAGAFQSPQLLMVSGVGPAATLKQHGITPVINLPGVGQNMWDHVLWPTVYEVGVETTGQLSDPAFAHAASQQYLQNKTGILTTQNADYLGWEKIPASYQSQLTAQAKKDFAGFPADWPDLEFVVGSFNPTTYLSNTAHYAFMAVGLVAPTSRGSIDISSADTADPPIINVGWLTNETDIEAGVIAVQRARDFWATKALQGVRIGEEVLPGKNVTNANLRDWVVRYVQTIYHASCTCKMGKSSDPMAVVDSKARVHGVQNLRVVDASAFALLPPGHPQSTIYAFAEKIVEDIMLGR